MTARSDLQDLLVADGYTVDQIDGDEGIAMRAIDYGDAGRVWVLISSYDIDGPAELLEVVFGVPPGLDIDVPSKDLWDHINSHDDYTCLSYSAVYGSPPLAGRDLPPADYVTIEVRSSDRLRDKHSLNP